MENFNVSAFLAINQYAGTSELLDLVTIAAGKVMPYFFILVLAVVWFATTTEKKKISMNAGFSVLVGLFVSYIIGLLYFHPRPFMMDLGTQLLEHAPDTSLPSDHATFLFSIAFMFLFSRHTRGLGVVLCVLGFIGGFARVYAGVHFPMDVISAALVGIFSSLVILLLVTKTNASDWFFDQFMKVRFINGSFGPRSQEPGK